MSVSGRPRVVPHSSRVLCSLVWLVVAVEFASLVGPAEGDSGVKLGDGQRNEQQQRHQDPGPPSRDSPDDGHLLARRRSSGLHSGSYFLAELGADRPLDGSRSEVDATLLEALGRIGPDMRPTGGFRDSSDISLEVSKRAWRLMREHARLLAEGRAESVGPLVDRMLAEANVSQQCRRAAGQTLQAAGRLEAWAVQLINSWGSFPPSGLFEGTFGDIGSYYGCLNVPENPHIGHAHYCTLAYRPVVPARKDYELILRQEPPELLRMFDRPQGPQATGAGAEAPERDTFAVLMGKAQYSHYVYYKLGTCFPIACHPFDVQRLALLIGRRSLLISGPVKCNSKFDQDYEQELVEAPTGGNGTARQHGRRLLLSSKDLNDGVYIWKPHVTRSQWVALVVVCAVSGLILALTLVDLVLNRLPKLCLPIDQRGELGPEQTVAEAAAGEEEVQLSSIRVDANNNEDDPLDRPIKEVAPVEQQSTLAQAATTDASKCLMMQLVDDFSIVTNTREYFQVGEGQLKNDILCINGLRCITMSWIIVAHTMQYNDWSAFARTYEVEGQLESLVNQPLFNASYLVDTFFLMSGLLTAFSAFKLRPRPTTRRIARPSPSSKLAGDPLGQVEFSCRSYLIGRYLRLTPQILLISLLFILLPLLSQTGGPHWYTMTGEYSENCSNNWWISLFHIQAFYKPSEMCNFVCWWISVDMFYHLLGLFVILIILKFGHRIVIKVCLLLAGLSGIYQASRHYKLKLPPNMLSTIPQTGAMWSEMTLNFFWKPEAHLFPFLFGFLLGYSMAQRRSQINKWLSPRRALTGWLLTIGAFVLISYGTYFWVIGKWSYSNELATCYCLITQIVWSIALGWIIIACQFNYGGFINRLLSCKLFIILGKASYIVYLSHFLILFSFFGSQNLLLEPTQVMMLYVILGNVCLSMLFGSLLCIVFEMPWLKMQRRIMRNIR